MLFRSIYLDAFSSFYSHPYHLATKEALTLTKNSLNENGILITNIISSIYGDTGKFLRAELKTLKEVFPQVYIFPIQNPGDGAKIQNIMIVALKTPQELTPSDKYKDFLKNLWQAEIPEDLPTLTDEFAPVDQYVFEMLK